MEAGRPTPGDAATIAAAATGLAEIAGPAWVEIAGRGNWGKSGTINSMHYIPCLRWRRPRFLAVPLFTPRCLRSNASVCSSWRRSELPRLVLLFFFHPLPCLRAAMGNSMSLRRQLDATENIDSRVRGNCRSRRFNELMIVAPPPRNFHSILCLYNYYIHLQTGDGLSGVY